MSSAVKCLIVLAIVALLFITELIPLAITAMGGAIACGLLGFIPAQQVFFRPFGFNGSAFCRYVRCGCGVVSYRSGTKNWYRYC